MESSSNYHQVIISRRRWEVSRQLGHLRGPACPGEKGQWLERALHDHQYLHAPVICPIVTDYSVLIENLPSPDLKLVAITVFGRHL